MAAHRLFKKIKYFLVFHVFTCFLRFSLLLTFLLTFHVFFYFYAFLVNSMFSAYLSLFVHFSQLQVLVDKL